MKFIQRVCFLILYCSNIFASFFDFTGLYNEKFKIGLFYDYERRELCFQSLHPTEILLDMNGKQFRYFDQVYTEYRAQVLSNSVRFSLVANPFSKIKYLLGVRKFTSENTLLYSQRLVSTNDGGYGCSFALGYTIFPQTELTPDIVAGAMVTADVYNFDTILATEAKYRVDGKITVVNTSFCISFTKMLKPFLEVNCTGKVVYRNSSIVDNVNLYKVTGQETFVNLALNNRFYLTKNESLNLSFDFAVGKEEYNISSSLVISWW